MKEIFLAFVIFFGCACLDSRAERLPFDVRNGYCDNGIFYMIDRNDGWARGTNSILKTTDGCVTWKNVLPTKPREPIGAFFYDAKTAWAVVGLEDDATNATIFHTMDGGRSWARAEVSESSPIMACSLSFPDKNNGWMMLIPEHGMNSMPGELFRTDNAGRTWFHINGAQVLYNPESFTDAEFERVQPSPPCGGRILFRDARNGWLVGSFTTTTPDYLFVTCDAGTHWQGQTLALPPWLPHGRMAPVGPPGFSSRKGKDGIIEATFVPESGWAEKVIAVTYELKESERIWHARAPAQADEKARTASAQMLRQGRRMAQLQFVDEKHGWAVTLGNDLSGQLFRTENGGKTWMEVQPQVQ